MRLVGATNWRIRVPFLIEGLVEALVGAALAIITLFLVKVFVVDQLRGRIVWLPLIRNGVLFIAVIMLVSATVLVANTLRMGMFARRKEIGIMRLVGATNWRIRVPFLIEGLVEALVGAALAIITLFLVKVFVVDQLRGRIVWLPLIRNGDVLAITPWILIAAAGVSIVAGTIGIRRFLDV